VTAAQPLAGRERRLASVARRRLRTAGLSAAAVFLLLVIVAAVAPAPIAPYPPNATDLLHILQPPGAAHPFGTDQLGRDTFSRIVFGARTTLALGVTATALGFVAGLVWGLIAGLTGRVVDEVVMRTADVFMSVPSLLLILLVITVFGGGERNAAIAIAIGIAPGFARLVRAQTLVVRRSGYVNAAIALGRPAGSVIVRHVVPNVVAPLFVFATMTVGQAVIVVASLSFLGLGAQAPTAEWGLMLAEARGYLARAPWLGVFPGLAITLTVLCIAAVGRELQLRFEGRTAS
jgi:peptide/nickel transport system permease protein